MKFIILTLFPDMFVGPFDHSIIKRAKEKGAVDISFLNIRDFALDNHKSVDDRPYGGGQGMILRVDVVDRALTSAKQSCIDSGKTPYTILLDPRGKTYTQHMVEELTHQEAVILVCGHYEGVDERIRSLVDETISIGDYIVTGGELPAIMIVDSITRFLPGVLKKNEARHEESFTDNLLEYPQYTRPEVYKSMNVPSVLLSGNHNDIENWKKTQQHQLTKKTRPDILQ